MKRGKDLVGMPVLSLANGEIVGRVKDILFDPRSHRLLGILIENGSWLKGPRKIAFVDFEGIGEDAITIATEKVIKKVRHEDESLIAKEEGFLGNRVLTRDGDELGRINDVIINQNTGEITHYQISDGIIQDLLEGRGLIPSNAHLTFGRDVIIIDMAQN